MLLFGETLRRHFFAKDINTIVEGEGATDVIRIVPRLDQLFFMNQDGVPEENYAQVAKAEISVPLLSLLSRQWSLELVVLG